MKRSFRTAALVALSTLALTLAAHAKLSQKGDASVSAKVTMVPLGSFTLTTSDLTVADDGSNVTVSVALANLKTGIELRDKHTKKHLGADENKTVDFVVSRDKLKFPDKGGDSSGDAAGTLSLHGVKKPASVHYSAHNDGGTIAVNGTIHINYLDFGMEKASYAGVGVKPELDVNVTFNVVDK